MTRDEWLLKFRRHQSPDTLEKVYEMLKYSGDPADEYAMTCAWDHRRAELAAGRHFDRVPMHVWRFVE